MVATIELLGKQHQEVLAQLATLETQLVSLDDGADLASFAHYLDSDLACHFTIEEQALFPVMARHLSLGEGPLAVMHAEHAAFRELAGALRAAVRLADRTQQRRCVFDLIDLLRAHIEKEDHVLFPMATRLLSPDEQREVDTRAAELAGS